MESLGKSFPIERVLIEVGLVPKIHFDLCSLLHHLRFPMDETEGVDNRNDYRSFDKEFEMMKINEKKRKKSKGDQISLFFQDIFQRDFSPRECNVSEHFVKAANERYIYPLFTKEKQLVLEIECGCNKGLLYLSKLCQGSRGQCILHYRNWLTPNEFQFISGRETAKDWKRSIRHSGKSIKLLINKGIITVHSPICECGTNKTNDDGLIRKSGKMSNAELLRSTPNFQHHQQSQMSFGRRSPEQLEKRESRLTSIIDQLLISRSFGGVVSAVNGASDGSPQAAADPDGQEDAVKKPSMGRKKNKHVERIVERHREQTEVVKNERLSPEERSASTSPPLKQMEHMMTRNYSDLMRNLAAKYNHTNPNEYPSRMLDFDSRFLKPGAREAAAAASLLISSFEKNLEKDMPFPVIDMSSTNTLLSMVRSAQSNQIAENYVKTSAKRANSPLDLSASPSPTKKKKNCVSACITGCSTEAQSMVSWSVEEVCRFVQTIDLCREYVQAFKDQSIDGSSLPLLTEDHLMTNMNMKLGPALKFKSVVAKLLGNCSLCSHCIHCHENNNGGANNNDKQ